MDVGKYLNNDPMLSWQITKQIAASISILFFSELSRFVTKQEVKSGLACSLKLIYLTQASQKKGS